ncbi:hypothetical protein D3C76_1037310 [compost metagenome]
MLDAQRHALRAHLAVAGGLGAGDVGVEGRPLGADAAALHAEADLHAAWPAVVGLGVDRHRPGLDFLVADALGAAGQHLEGVVPLVVRHAGARPGHAHMLLGLDVPRFQLFVAERPVEHVGALDVAVLAAHAELEVAKTQGNARPVHGAATHRLDDPRRQVRVVARHVPATGGDALVEPGDLVEHGPFIVLDVGHFKALAGFQHHAADALPGQGVGQGAAAGARADDDDDIAVVLGEFRCHGVNPHCWNG